jgi:WD40 repeat protein
MTPEDLKPIRAQPNRRLLQRLCTFSLYSLLSLSVLATIYLFSFTGRPLPSNKQDASGNSLPPVGELSWCSCISNCGQFGFWEIGKLLDPDRIDLNLEMWRLGPPQRIGGIPLASGIISACLSKNQRLLLTLSSSTVDLWRLPSFELVRTYECPINSTYRGLAFSQNEKQILVFGYSQVLEFDADSDKLIEVKLIQPSDDVEAVFADPSETPKYVISRDQVIEIVDLRSDRIDCSLQLSASGRPLAAPWIGGLDACKVSHDGGFLVTGHANGMVLLWSLPDGAPLARFQLSGSASAFPVGLSPDGRYLLVAQYARNRLVLAAERLSPELGAWLEHRIEPESATTVIDLKKKIQWPGLPFAQKVGFSADSKELLTIGKTITKWDLPPRWRPFSPWAWVALTVCLLQISALRFMKRVKVRSAKLV